MTLDVAIAAVVWGLMWVVGLELTGDDFRRVVTQTRAVVATLGSLLLLPLLAAAILLESGEWPAGGVAGLVPVATSEERRAGERLRLPAPTGTAAVYADRMLLCLIAVVTLPVLTQWGFRTLARFGFNGRRSVC